MKNANVRFGFGFVALVLALCACAGADNGEMFDDAEIGDGGDELGQVEQAYGAKETDTLQFGTTPGGMRCNKTSTGQTCNFLRVKPNVKVCVDYTLPISPGPLSGIEGAYASNGLNNVDIAAPSYTFDYSNSDLGFGCSATGSAGSHIIIRKGTLSGSSSSNNKNDFARPVFSDLTNLSEQTGVVGNYASAGNCIITFDAAKCKAKGATSSEDERYCTNAVAFAVAGCLGIGGQQASQATTRITALTPMSSTQFANALSAAETCQMTSLSLTNDGNFQEHTPACSGD